MQKEQIIRLVKIITTSLIIILLINFTMSIIGILGTPLEWIVSKYKLDNYLEAVYGEDVKYKGKLKYDFMVERYYYSLVIKDRLVSVGYNLNT